MTQAETLVDRPDGRHDILADILAQAGISVTLKAIREAATRLYPHGLPERVTDRRVVQAFLGYFKKGSQNTV